MVRTTNRPFFSADVLLIATLIVIGGVLVSKGLVAILYRFVLN
jgi:hypothetical protein